MKVYPTADETQNQPSHSPYPPPLVCVNSVAT